MTTCEHRQILLTLIRQACDSGARLQKACMAFLKDFLPYIGGRLSIGPRRWHKVCGKTPDCVYRR